MIFDLDGTLLDTIDDLADAMNAALVKRGYPPRTPHECRYLVGDGAEHFASGALPAEARQPEIITELTQSYLVEYAINWNRKTAPYPGISELLPALTEQNIPMAVLSNKPDAFVRQTVSHYFPKIPFAAICGARPGSALKPNPATARHIAKHLGCPPERIFFVGDTRTDMHTACAAGMIPVGVLWGFREARELLANGARHLIKQPADFLLLLESIRTW